ncbi:MAG: IscS subfamily cysteine desulfurase [Legionellales bacterium]|nr:IscS subfamily cysteine desulfurase [Legionellales bacterium]
MNNPIYLDYMATTPVDRRVAEQMLLYLTADGDFGNPSSAHDYGKRARHAIQNARAEVAQLLNAQSEEIIFTSGATEAINLALFGAAYHYQRKGKHIITSNIEHKAVFNCCEALSKQGFSMTYLPVDHNGLLVVEDLKKAIRPDTILISLAHVNNEIGIINPVHDIGQIAREAGIIFHVDAAQSLGKIPVNVREMKIDLLSLSAHKIYGPKGSGALFVSKQPRIKLQPYLVGGGQEQGLRGGTLATHQIIGLGRACELVRLHMAEEVPRIQAFRDQFWNAIKHLPGIILNGSWEKRVAHNLNISFENIHGEALVMALQNLALSTGSACNAASLDPSPVILALGRKPHVAHASLRISFGRFTEQTDVDDAINYFLQQVKRLQTLSVFSV